MHNILLLSHSVICKLVFVIITDENSKIFRPPSAGSPVALWLPGGAVRRRAAGRHRRDHLKLGPGVLGALGLWFRTTKWDSRWWGPPIRPTGTTSRRSLPSARSVGVLRAWWMRDRTVASAKVGTPSPLSPTTCGSWSYTLERLWTKYIKNEK